MRVISKNRERQIPLVKKEQRRGRAAISNASGRFERARRSEFEDGWQSPEDMKPIKTEVFREFPKRIISYNQSPDIPFERSINPYRGCEHGCIYCFARPSHAYIGFSAGLDFETKLFVKPDAAKLLENELSNPNYSCGVIAMGTNTDPYQPIEKKWRIMRQILEVLEAYAHPVTILTKSALVVRDIDILERMAKRRLAKVAFSITTLDHNLARVMEPRAATPGRRLGALKAMSEAGIPTAVMVAPIIPALNDHEIESILEASQENGALGAAYIFLRLPLEIKTLFREWLEENFPDRAERVLHHIRTMKGGRYNNPGFHDRFKNHGSYADIIKQRFKTTCKRLHLNETKSPLDTTRFKVPAKKGEQFNLFFSSR
ncbi:MAG: PA0069 family radical SAM protein [Alphaproteobacteria bacterium]|nr:MAG: PA0069 family radical SAM protein [Alphaproteobacteria bacterium]